MHRRIWKVGLVVAFAALGVLGCDNSISPGDADSPRQPSLAVTAFAITGMRGTGGMGPGTPTFFGIERQWFDFDVSGGPPSGRLDYIDSAFVKSDGHYPHLTTVRTEFGSWNAAIEAAGLRPFSEATDHNWSRARRVHS